MSRSTRERLRAALRGAIIIAIMSSAPAVQANPVHDRIKQGVQSAETRAIVQRRIMDTVRDKIEAKFDHEFRQSAWAQMGQFFYDVATGKELDYEMQQAVTKAIEAEVDSQLSNNGIQVEILQAPRSDYGVVDWFRKSFAGDYLLGVTWTAPSGTKHILADFKIDNMGNLLQESIQFKPEGIEAFENHLIKVGEQAAEKFVKEKANELVGDFVIATNEMIENAKEFSGTIPGDVVIALDNLRRDIQESETFNDSTSAQLLRDLGELALALESAAREQAANAAEQTRRAMDRAAIEQDLRDGFPLPEAEERLKRGLNIDWDEVGRKVKEVNRGAERKAEEIRDDAVRRVEILDRKLRALSDRLPWKK